jgi:hypothetical protein
MSKFKFKAIPKKRKRENVNNIPKPEKKIKTHKKNLPCNVKV